MEGRQLVQAKAKDLAGLMRLTSMDLERRNHGRSPPQAGEASSLYVLPGARAGESAPFQREDLGPV